MRTFQFWLLILGSTLVSALLIKQIFLERALNQQRRVLVDCQEKSSTGPAFENAWKQLAARIYQASSQDPALLEVLKHANVQVHTNSAEGGVAPVAPSTPAGP